MDFITLLFIAVGLSADSFAVAFSRGLCVCKYERRELLRTGFILAFFQGIAPLIGWFAGVGLESIAKSIDHWIAFTLLSLIGAKMIYDSYGKKDNCIETTFNNYSLIMAGVGTSIDALVVGISFGLTGTPILQSCLTIFIITFLFSTFAYYIGNKTKQKTKVKLELFAGLLLIGMGIKILIEHLYKNI